MKMENIKKSFILHNDSLGILNELSDEQAGQLFKLIYNYHNPNKPIETQITQLVNLSFYQFKNQFDRDLQSYNNVCERNKNNGKLGGRPKKNNPDKPKKADNDNDNDNDNDSENVIEIKKEKYKKKNLIFLKEEARQDVFFEPKWQIEFTLDEDGNRIYGNLKDRMCGGLSEFGIIEHCENRRIEYVK